MAIAITTASSGPMLSPPLPGATFLAEAAERLSAFLSVFPVSSACLRDGRDSLSEAIRPASTNQLELPGHKATPVPSTSQVTKSHSTTRPPLAVRQPATWKSVLQMWLEGLEGNLPCKFVGDVRKRRTQCGRPRSHPAPGPGYRVPGVPGERERLQPSRISESLSGLEFDTEPEDRASEKCIPGYPGTVRWYSPASALSAVWCGL
eukprot:1604744-Rhodomonas_salina.3